LQLAAARDGTRREQGGTTFKMLAAFENWFARSGEFGARQLAILRMLGLFDRPADAGCIGALRQPPPIAGLTEPWFSRRVDAGGAIVQPIADEDWNTATSFLAEFGLTAISEYHLNPIKGFSKERATTQITLGLRGSSPYRLIHASSTSPSRLSDAITDPNNIALWLSGYYNGKRNNTIVKVQSFKEDLKKVKDYCITHETVTVMQALEVLLGVGN
jgi:hypothetical protein